MFLLETLQKGCTAAVLPLGQRVSVRLTPFMGKGHCPTVTPEGVCVNWRRPTGQQSAGVVK